MRWTKHVYSGVLLCRSSPSSQRVTISTSTAVDHLGLKPHFSSISVPLALCYYQLHAYSVLSGHIETQESNTTSATFATFCKGTPRPCLSRTSLRTVSPQEGGGHPGRGELLVRSASGPWTVSQMNEQIGAKIISEVFRTETFVFCSFLSPFCQVVRLTAHSPLLVKPPFALASYQYC